MHQRAMALSLPAGTYTIILTDAGYIPNAIFDNGALSEDFTDLTGGSFPVQTCVDSANCNTDSPAWALDITTPNSPTALVPEPQGLQFFSFAAIVLVYVARRNS